MFESNHAAQHLHLDPEGSIRDQNDDDPLTPKLLQQPQQQHPHNLQLNKVDGINHQLNVDKINLKLKKKESNLSTSLQRDLLSFQYLKYQSDFRKESTTKTFGDQCSSRRKTAKKELESTQHT